ncbi:MAG: hypothetical protein J1F18_07560 [Lachnospiraceae bacterium]|nr:hypothetical protein [Lachnospiraceae bacterium]
MKKATRNTKILKLIAIMVFTVVLFFVALLLLCNTEYQTVYAEGDDFGGGDGTADSPYKISTDAHLQRLSANVQGGGVNGYNGVYFILENNIDLTEISNGSLSGWMPIGTTLYPFHGVFMGNNKKISGVNINRISDNIGLFGVTGETAVIKDLTVDGLIRGGAHTGGVVGYNSGRVENSVNYAAVGVMSSSATDTGGVVGYNSNGTLIGNSNYGEVTNTAFNVGGIAGTNDGSILKCFNVGVVNGKSNVGGISGTNSRDGQISEVFNNGKLIVSSNFAGGIVGDNKGKVCNTYNSGTILSNGIASDYFGGIVGNNDGSNGSEGIVCHSYNIGIIDSVSFYGHISAFNTGVIEKCYFNSEFNSGDVTNGLFAVNTFGLTSKVMLDADTLTKSGKMDLLNEDGVWIRRNFDNDYVYFPELSALYSFQQSKESTKFERIELYYEDIQLGETDFEYNGEAHNMDILLGDIKLIEDLDYVVLSNPINVRGDNGSLIVLELINYYAGTVSKEFTIHKRPITVVWSNETFYYNGKEQYHTVTVESGRVKDENITFVYYFNSNINAGEHIVEVALEDTAINSNYQFTPQTHKYTIHKNPITISWSNEEYVYSGKVQHHIVIVESGRIGTEVIEFDYSYDDCISAGQHTVTAYLIKNTINANYEFAPQSHSFVIKPQSLLVSWDNEELIYNGQVQHPIASVVGIINNESVTLVYNGFENNICAADGYSVVVSLEDTVINANYVLIGEVERIYSIVKSDLVIEWDDNELIYNGKPQKPSFSIVSGQIINEIIEFDFSDYSKNINACIEYFVEVSLMSNSINMNYMFVPQIKTYTIKKAPIILIWESEDLVYNGEIQHPVAKIASPIFDEINLIYANYYGRDAYCGYTIDISVDNINYEIINSLTYDILPKVIQVKWLGENIQYNGLAQRPEYIIIGVLNNETINEIISDYSSNIIPNEYEVTILSCNPNYIFDDTDHGIYSIVKRKIYIENVTAIDRCYDDTQFVELCGGVLIDLIGNDEVSFVLGQGQLLDVNAGYDKIVQTDIILVGTHSIYYDLCQPNLTVNIFKAIIDMSAISFNAQVFTYDGTPKSIFISGSLSKHLNVEYQNNGAIEVGVYTVIANFTLLDDINFESVLPLVASLYIVDAYKFEFVTIEIFDGNVLYGTEFQVKECMDILNISGLEKYKLQRGFTINLVLNEELISLDGVLKFNVVLQRKVLHNNTLKVYSIIDGTLHEIEYGFEKNMLVFYTDRIGEFVIVTRKSYDWISAIAILIILITIVACISFFLRRVWKSHRKASVAVLNDSNTIAQSEQVIENSGLDKIEKHDIKSDSHDVPQIEFVFDSVYCKNYACFMESLNFRTVEKQIAVCGGDLSVAKLYEAKPQNSVFWKGQRLKVNGKKYIQLLADVLEVINNAKKDN